jgi:hypothetical protein
MNIWKASTVALAFVLTGVLANSTVQPAAAEDGENQKRMEAALDSLTEAQTKLENATADKGGHRVKALKAVKEAIKETKAGIAYDKAH